MGASKGINLDQADAVLFGAPHGTPYQGIDNEVYAKAPDAMRAAMEEDSAWPDHWDFDLDGPLLGDGDCTIADAGDLKTASQDGSGNRVLIETATAEIMATGAVPIMLGGDD